MSSYFVVILFWKKCNNKTEFELKRTVQLYMQKVNKKISFRISLVVSMILMLSMVSSLSFGQKIYPFYQGWKANINIGTTNFHGDIKNSSNGFFDNTPLSKFFYQDRRFAGGVRLEKNINSMFSISGQANYGKLAGTSDLELREFTANIFEYSILTHFYLDEIFLGSQGSRKWGAYAFVGIGLTESRTWQYSTLTGDLSGTNGFASKKGILFENRPMTETVLPVGFGGTYELGDGVELNLEYSFHPINTDKLDAWISNEAKIEGYGYLSVGISKEFTTPKHWSLRGGMPSYTGKSSDSSIKAYNKKKRVVMTNRGQQRKAAKKRYVYKPKRRKKRKLKLSR